MSEGLIGILNEGNSAAMVEVCCMPCTVKPVLSTAAAYMVAHDAPFSFSLFPLHCILSNRLIARQIS